jgi:DNA-binding CsgD family transcriptional regulator
MTGPLIRVHLVRQAAMLIGEVHELGASTEEGRAHLVAGMLDIVGAAVGAVLYDTRFASGLREGVECATAVNFDGDVRRVLETHHLGGAGSIPYHGALIRRMEHDGSAAPSPSRPHEDVGPLVFTHTRGDLVTDEDWRVSPWVNEHALPARLDHFLGSERIVGRARAVAFGFMRSASDPPFSDEDREVLHMVHLGVGCVFDTAARPPLAPRVRATLAELLSGAADKEIATRLGISSHTVREYIKTIYRVYGVSSRAELIAHHARKRRS